MNRALAIEFSRVTEAAALAAYTWLGRGNKNAADEAAVKAMRYMLNLIHMDGEIVIGEGEIDEAPMLYIGEKVGSGNGELVSIAVDPIDGTRMTAMGQSNAISVLAAGGKRTFLKAPDMYMEKLVVGPEVKGMIDLSLPIEQNLRRVASRLGKSLSDLTVMVLAKPRHRPAGRLCRRGVFRGNSVPPARPCAPRPPTSGSAAAANGRRARRSHRHSRPPRCRPSHG